MRAIRIPSPVTRHPSPLSGVTLAEVLIAVAIVAILASVALPQYQKTIERNYRQQAQDLLTTIYYGERAYRLANNKFLKTTTWTDIFMDDPHVGATPPINFAVTGATTTQFKASATRSGGTCGGKALSIDETRNIAGSWTACP